MITNVPSFPEPPESLGVCAGQEGPQPHGGSGPRECPSHFPGLASDRSPVHTAGAEALRQESSVPSTRHFLALMSLREDRAVTTHVKKGPHHAGSCPSQQGGCVRGLEAEAEAGWQPQGICRGDEDPRPPCDTAVSACPQGGPRASASVLGLSLAGGFQSTDPVFPCNSLGTVFCLVFFGYKYSSAAGSLPTTRLGVGHPLLTYAHPPVASRES